MGIGIAASYFTELERIGEGDHIVQAGGKIVGIQGFGGGATPAARIDFRFIVGLTAATLTETDGAEIGQHGSNFLRRFDTSSS